MKSPTINDGYAHVMETMVTGSLQKREPRPFSSCLEQLEKIGTAEQYGKNHYLAKRGRVPDCCYLVKSGQVVGFEELPSGEELYHYVMDANTLFLEANVLYDVPAPIYFKTVEPTEVIRIRRKELETALLADPCLMLTLFHSVSHKFFEAMDELREIKSHSSAWRMCKLLLSYAEQYGAAYDGKILIRKKLSIQVMTSLLGVNRATTVRALRQLRDMGLVENINGYYCVRSMEALRQHQQILSSM